MGGKFAEFLEIIKITGAKFYFCHPYAPCEKKANEKYNSIIRYFIPKSTLIKNYTVNEINHVCH